MKKAKPFLLSLFLTICCFSVHVHENVNSLLNDNNYIISNDYLLVAVEYHKENVSFVKRPVTTFLVEKIASFSKIEIGEAFVTISFLFIFMNGVLMFFLAQHFTKNNTLIVSNVILYFLCFSNLFAFFKPIYTYDEPVQFFFILLSLMTLLKNKKMLFVLILSKVLSFEKAE